MMMHHWTRRHFLRLAAAAGYEAWPLPAAWARTLQELPPPQSQKNSPEITAGRVAPLLTSNVSRPLRYSAGEGAFSIRNGAEFFNRPLYGPNTPFRVDGGDRPEFSLYLPGHGGNLRLGVLHANGGGKWLFQCESVVSTYANGYLLYRITDPLLGSGATLHLECLTLGAGFWIQAFGENLRSNLMLTWAFGGVSGRKGKRNGDIGCEVEPVSQFFQLRPEECRGNRWSLQPSSTVFPTAEVQGTKTRIRITGPHGSSLRLGHAKDWNSPWATLWDQKQSASPELPLLLGQAPLGNAPVLLSLEVLDGTVLPPPSSTPPQNRSLAFANRRSALQAIAMTIRSHTPDPFLDGMFSALGIACDAIWDEAQGCVMHGAVAWRMPLAGWRGPYVLDVTGHHERMRRHLRRWIARQNQSPVVNGSGGRSGPKGFTNILEATGNPDPGSEGTRSEALLHSNGDLSHNHYDMNLVFFDALLRHLRWTGDLDFARETWPALERHAAWERRLFRREYGSGDQTEPLYEAYAAIWASDNLQYNGGGATHSSAYNVYLNRSMAALAQALGASPEDVASYRNEADATERAMRVHLWMADRGAFAESREWLGDRHLAENPAVWTMYQVIDSEIPNPIEAWQIAADRLRVLRKVPVVGEGVPADAGWQISCSDWQPYVWSLTLLVLAENLATALALFQAGLADNGYALLRGSLLDSGYRGLCPGNFPMSLQLDPHRQESQRDFGDPIGCASRALVEGLWGISPNLLAGTVAIRPQLPLSWEQARFTHPEISIEYERRDGLETWRITSSFTRSVSLRLELRARTTQLPRVTLQGKQITPHFMDNAVGEPRLLLDNLGHGPHWDLEIEWRGEAPLRATQQPIQGIVGQTIHWPAKVQVHHLHDPQMCLRAGIPVRAGGHTIFAQQIFHDCRYWLPLNVHISEAPSVGRDEQAEVTTEERFEPVPLASLLTGQVREILTRGYNQPRSGLCSLGIPNGLLGGWANFDATATISDAGLRRAGGSLRLGNGVSFLTPSDSSAPNCCFLSHWAQDKPQVSVPLHGHARSLHLLIAGTTYPQATSSTHATVRVHYSDPGPATEMNLRSPATWWPVEQDYLVDDFLFPLEPADAPEQSLPYRVHLLTGDSHPLSREELRGKGGPIKGGAAFMVSVELHPERELAALELRCERYGIVLGLLGVTLGR